jgi:hypothetical protein
MEARNYICCGRRSSRHQAPAHAADIAANGRHAYLSRDLIVLRTLEGLEMTMSNESRRVAGILLIVLPTVMYGGVSVLSLLIGDPKYMENPLRQDLWRAGHAHAGVWLILALVAHVGRAIRRSSRRS